MTDAKTFTKNGFMAKKYNSLLIASLLGWVVSLVGSLSDGILAGVFISEEAVGAVKLVSPLFNILLFFATLLGVGVSTLFSAYLGAFDKEKAARLNGTGLLSAVLAGIVFAVLMFVFRDLYFGFFGSGEIVDSLGRDYYACFYILAFTYPMYWLVYYLVSADGDHRNILWCDLVNAITNPIFSILLVGKFGIVGLGYGTVSSNLITIVILAAHFFKKNNAVKFKMAFSAKELGKIFSIGSSMSLAQIYIAIVDIIMIKIVISQLGESYLAAYSVINLILNFGGCFSCSIDAAGPFVSVAYGENNTVVQQNAMRLASKNALVLGIVFTVIEFALAGIIPKLYGISDPEIYAAAVYAGRILALTNIGMAFEKELADYYPRINQIFLSNFFSIVYSLIAPIVLIVPLSYALGFNGIIWGFFLTPYVTLALGFLYVAFRHGRSMFPFLIATSTDTIFVHEIEIEDKEIVELNAVIGEELKSCNVDSSIIIPLQLMIEETFMIVKERNSGKKILADCSIIVGKENVRLITRDNGEIFDITDVDAKINSLRQYVTARIIEENDASEYLTTISFNRNSYLWSLGI